MRVRPSLPLCLIVGIASSGCSGDRGTEASSESANTTDTSESAEQTGDGDGDPSTGDGDPSTGDGDPSTGDGDGDPTTGDGDGDGDDIKFDMAAVPDAGDMPCQGMGMGGDDVEFSYIWIANSAEGTLTKLNTQTL